MITLENTLYRIAHVGNRSKESDTYWGRVELQDGKLVIPDPIQPAVEDIRDPHVEKETITGLVEANVIYGIHHTHSIKDGVSLQEREKTTYFLIHKGKAYALSGTRVKGYVEGSTPLEDLLKGIYLSLWFN